MKRPEMMTHEIKCGKYVVVWTIRWNQRCRSSFSIMANAIGAGKTISTK
ncbi:hypothetical protein OMP38_16790 [Cohnella ginsengisoli]|uniref:Uncharacterized protein n=1 Tax=Cohnella ginsengisoli TaxID=425004 RepID=A0A9X4KIX7_9BACL|nr:hypothetical protein [Cohnella ginsengisoli]MDG0792339.1 hypothetical protein [Cohnella ginsengisoli]